MSAASKDERPWELGDSEDFVREVNPVREAKSSDRAQWIVSFVAACRYRIISTDKDVERLADDLVAFYAAESARVAELREAAHIYLINGHGKKRLICALEAWK